MLRYLIKHNDGSVWFWGPPEKQLSDFRRDEQECLASMRGHWARVHTAIEANDFFEVSKLMLEMKRDFGNLQNIAKMICIHSSKDHSVSGPEHFQPTIPLLSLIENTYFVKRSKARSMQPVVYAFEDMIPTLEFICDQSNISADEDNVLLPLIENDIKRLIASDTEERDQWFYDGLFSRLFWAVNSLIKLKTLSSRAQERIAQCDLLLPEHKFDEVKLWSFFSHTDYITVFVEKAKKIGLIRPSEFVRDLEARINSLSSLSPQEIFGLLISDPQRVVVKRYLDQGGVLGANHKEFGVLLQREYSALSECHCDTKLSRGVGSLRVASEDYTVDLAKTYQSKELRIAVVGSGQLLQVAILLAKLTKKHQFKSLQIDLLDPCMFNPLLEPSQYLNQFIFLLDAQGFTVVRGYGLIKIGGINDSVTSVRGQRITIDCHRNEEKNGDQIFNQPVDIIFMNDCPISNEKLSPILEAAKPGAHFVQVSFRSIDASLPHKNKREVYFEVREKEDKQWKSLFVVTQADQIPVAKPITFAYASSGAASGASSAVVTAGAIRQERSYKVVSS